MVRALFRSKFYLVVVACCGLSFAKPVRADYASCKTQSEKAVADCTAAAATVEGAKSGTAAKAAAAASGSGTSDNGFSLSGVALDGAAADKQGQTYCEAQRESGCIAACTKAIDPKQKALAEEAKNKCVSLIGAQLAKFAASSGGLSAGSMMAAATGLKALAGGLGGSQGGGSSGGGSGGLPDLPTGLPGPTTPTANNPPGTTPTVTPPPTPTTQPPPVTPPGTTPILDTQANCNGSQAYILEECSGQMTTNCSGKFHSSGACESFSARFCSTTPDSGQGSQAALKAGEGVGTPFCTAYNGSSFCAGAGTSQCPSCSGVTAAAGAVLPDVCKNDPAFSNPQIAQALSKTLASKTLSGSGGGGSNGGGGGGGLGSSTASTAAAVEGNKTNAPTTTREGLNLGVDSGGGGGYSQNSDSSGGGDFDSSIHSSARRAMASNAAPASLTTLATDVEVKNTTSLFAISSQIIYARCKRGQLHCGTSAK